MTKTNENNDNINLETAERAIVSLIESAPNNDDVTKAEEILKENSINTNYVAEEVEFEVKRKKSNIFRDIIALALALLIMIGSLKLAIQIKRYCEENKNKKQVEQLVKDIKKLYGVDLAKIVEDNVREATIARSGEEVLGYVPADLAADIVDACKDNPKLFPVTLHKVFIDIPFSDVKITHMDIIFHSIKEITQNDESLQGIYEQIKDCTFLQYIVRNGYVDKNDENYAKLVEISESFNKGVHYEDLSFKDKKIVDDALRQYILITFSSEDLSFNGQNQGGR